MNENGRVPINQVYQQICSFARTLGAKKVVLFGSRARGDAQDKSDIDVAIYGCPHFRTLQLKLEEELYSLLEIDVIDMDAPHISEALIREIEKDGVTLYEEI